MNDLSTPERVLALQKLKFNLRKAEHQRKVLTQFMNTSEGKTKEGHRYIVKYSSDPDAPKIPYRRKPLPAKTEKEHLGVVRSSKRRKALILKARQQHG